MRRWTGKPKGGRKNAQRHTLICEWCGHNFQASRPDALTCCNAHRLAWSRWVRDVAARGKGVAVLGPRGDRRKQLFLSPLTKNK